MTNVIILSLTLVTNLQQAIVGESQGKALVASQETVIRRTITLEDVVLTSTVTTNAIGFAFPKPAPAAPFHPPGPLTNKPAINTDSPIYTNSPAYKRRLEREQRLRPATNAPPVQQTK
jgi:hypothetical protein